MKGVLWKLLGLFLVILMVVGTFPDCNSIKAAEPAVDESYNELNPQEAMQMISNNPGEVIILDVRTPEEFETGHITGAKLFPLSEMEQRLEELETGKILMVYCKAGVRSAKACQLLVDNGFQSIFNLTGGIDAWKAARLPVSDDKKIDGCQPCLNRMAASADPVQNSEVTAASAPGYCYSYGGSTYFERINNVSYELLSKGTLSVTVGVYISNPSNCVSGEPCATYDSSPEYVNGWIDWNNDNVFDESEKIIDADLNGYTGIGYTGTMATSAIVAVPDKISASPWMRVNLGWSHDPNNPCEEYWTYGNVVDTQISFNDLRVKDEDISITTPSKQDDEVTVSFKIYNSNTEIAEDVAYNVIKEFQGNVVDEEYEIVDVPAEGFYEGSVTWAYNFDKIKIEVDPDDEIEESNEENNKAESHSISGSVENNGGNKEVKTKVEYLEQSGTDWVSKYSCYTDDTGKYNILTNFEAISDKSTAKIRSSLEFAPERDSSKPRFRVYDDSEWGHASARSANAKLFSAESGSWTIDKTKDFISKDVKYAADNNVTVYDTLVKAYQYWAGLNPPIAPPQLIEVEVNDHDYVNHTSYQQGNTIHFWHTRSDKVSTIAHEYTHSVHASWNLQYNPVGENFANYGSSKSRGVSTYDFWGTNIDISNLEDTDGDNVTTAGNTADNLWNFQLAGVYWELDNDKLLTDLKQGASTAKIVYDQYPGSPDNATKQIFRKHGINTTGWLPAGGPDPDMFTGSYSAITIDNNADGKAEALNINCGLNISSGGTYYIYAFMEGTGDEYCFASTRQYLNPGIQTITLNYDGKSIFAQRLNGNYRISSIFIADENYNELDYRLNPFTTSETYNYTDFQPPFNYLTGNFTDAGVDTDGDSLFDNLRVGVEFHLTTAGNYRVEADLLDGSGNIIETGSVFKNCNAGTQLAYIDFKGTTINGSGKNGPYQIKEAYIFDENDIQVSGGIIPVYYTSAYLYEDFQTPDAGFSGTVTNQATDSDGDALGNYLTLGFNITANIEGLYQVKGKLFNTQGSFITSILSEFQLIKGSNSLEIKLIGEKIRESKADGPYDYTLELFDSNFNLVGSKSGQTYNYKYDQFQMSPSDKFSIVYSDYGLDINSDSLFEYLRLETNVSAVVPGNYTLFAYLFDQDNNLLSFTSQTTNLEAVAQQVYFDFKGQDIWSSSGGVFHISLAFYNSEDTIIATLDNVHSTNSYDYNQFTPSAASITDVYSDQGVDTNLDSLYNYLEVSVTVNISIAGDYTLRGSLFDSNGNEIETVENEAYFYTGNQTGNLRFNGKAIYDHALNGPYKLARIEILSNDVVVDSSNPDYETAAYDFASFGPLIALTGNYSDSGVDVDSDGNYELLSVNIGVSLANPGYCIVSARLVDSAGNEITTANKTVQCESSGQQTIKLDFSGDDIYTHGVDGPYYLKDVYIYHTGDPNSPDYSENAYTTGYYGYTQFGSLIALTGIYSDSGVDVDSDGNYELLSVNIGVNLANPGYCVGSARLVDSAGDEITTANDTVQFESSGQQTINLDFSGDDIYAHGVDGPYYLKDVYVYLTSNPNNTAFSENAYTTGYYEYTQFGEGESISISTPSQLTSGEVKLGYLQNIYCSGGTPKYTWSLPKTVEGVVNKLPSGLKLATSKIDSSIAIISGKPSVKINQPTEYTFYLQVKDSNIAANTVIKKFTLILYPTMVLTVPSLSKFPAEVGVPYAIQSTVSGGTGNYYWDITKGSLPEGLDLNHFTGVISGKPINDVSLKVTLSVTDTLGGTVSKSLSGKILKALSISTTALPACDIGVKYKSVKFKATGGKSPYTWSLISGSLPAGFTFEKGTLSGTPAPGTSNTYHLLIGVSDGIGSTNQSYSLVINPPLSISNLPDGFAGVSYTARLTDITTGGSGTGYKYSVKGTLPSGLKFNSKDASIAGTPAEGTEGTYSLSVKVTDSLKGTNTIPVNLVIKSP